MTTTTAMAHVGCACCRPEPSPCEAELAQVRRDRGELMRELDETQGERDAERVRANEWLAQLHDAKRERDDARAERDSADQRAKRFKYEAKLVDVELAKSGDHDDATQSERVRRVLADTHERLAEALALAGTVDPAGALESAYAELRQAAATIAADYLTTIGALQNRVAKLDAQRTRRCAYIARLHAAMRAKDAHAERLCETGWAAIVQRDRLAVALVEWADHHNDADHHRDECPGVDLGPEHLEVCDDCHLADLANGALKGGQ